MSTAGGWGPRARLSAAATWAAASGLCAVAVLLPAPARAGEAAATPPSQQAAVFLGEAGFVEMLLELGLPAEAAREAQRLMMSRGPDALPSTTAFQLGMALALAGDADRAVSFLTQASRQSEDPAASDQWQLAAGVALLRARSFPQAFHLFARIETFGVDEAMRTRATRLRCIGQVMAHDAAEARACIAALPPDARLRAEDVDELLSELELNTKVRGYVGGTLSAVVPGLGQATAGEGRSGLIAAIVNGAWGTGFYVLLAESAFIEATLIAVGIGIRYYLGNIRNGAAAWRNAADERRQRAAEQLMRILGGSRTTAPARR